MSQCRIQEAVLGNDIIKGREQIYSSWFKHLYTVGGLEDIMGYERDVIFLLLVFETHINREQRHWN